MHFLIVFRIILKKNRCKITEKTVTFTSGQFKNNRKIEIFTKYLKHILLLYNYRWYYFQKI